MGVGGNGKKQRHNSQWLDMTAVMGAIQALTRGALSLADS